MALIRSFQLEKDLEALACEYCPEDRRRPHAALYDALACSLLLLRWVKDPQFAEGELSWFLCGKDESQSSEILFSES
jgi:DNA polymerase III epsilon subunit-like protein